MVRNVVLQQAMHRDDILAEEFDVVFDMAQGNLAIVGNDLQRQVVRRRAGAALANALRFIKAQMAVKGDEHVLDLIEELLSRWWRPKPVEENGIAFDFGYLQPKVICLYDLFQELFDDVTAVRNLRGLDKSRKTTDIRNEQERWLGGVAGRSSQEDLPYW